MEKGHTNIYIQGKLFIQCKSLILNVDLKESSSYKKITSVDELFRESVNGQIIPEIEFWGHYSNLQAWAEYG
ncbi:MAG: hypothetical protein ACFFD7_02580 [Candidatus Thorarchaeota archaeon]